MPRGIVHVCNYDLYPIDVDSVVHTVFMETVICS